MAAYIALRGSLIRQQFILNLINLGLFTLSVIPHRSISFSLKWFNFRIWFSVWHFVLWIDMRVFESLTSMRHCSLNSWRPAINFWNPDDVSEASTWSSAKRRWLICILPTLIPFIVFGYSPRLCRNNLNSVVKLITHIAPHISYRICHLIDGSCILLCFWNLKVFSTATSHA